MKIPNTFCGFGTSPKNWFVAASERFNTYIFRDFMARAKPTAVPTVADEIRALCEARKISSTAWCALAGESAEAEKAVRASLANIPVVLAH